jgi:ubiquitin-conjugating enzyme E2 Q
MMSLNEIVNVPSKYLSHHPHLVVQHVDWIQCRYLLVQSAAAYRTATGQNAPDGDSASAREKDQHRYDLPYSQDFLTISTMHLKYLILICGSLYKLHELTFISRAKALSSVEIEQDPKRVATSISGKQIGIPECAMSVSRAFRTNRVSRSNSVKSSKRRKHTGSNTSLSGVDSAMSDDEDIEDINFLFSEDESPPSKSKRKAPNGLLTL